MTIDLSIDLTIPKPVNVSIFTLTIPKPVNVSIFISTIPTPANLNIGIDNIFETTPRNAFHLDRGVVKNLFFVFDGLQSYVKNKNVRMLKSF